MRTSSQGPGEADPHPTGIGLTTRDTRGALSAVTSTSLIRPSSSKWYIAWPFDDGPPQLPAVIRGSRIQCLQVLAVLGGGTTPAVDQDGVTQEGGELVPGVAITH